MPVNDNKKNSERRAKSYERNLDAWRRTLKNEPDVAEKAMRRAIGHLMSQNSWDPYDLMQFKSQMKNGVSCPSDFMSDSDSYTPLRRA